jgi:polysaccharide biosynthesis protein PslH
LLSIPEVKILFLANRFPYPPFRGDKLKIFNLTSRLSKVHELYLITFIEDKDELQYLSEIEPFFTEIITVRQSRTKSIWECIKAIPQTIPFQLAYFRNRKMHHVIQQFLKNHEIDLIHTQHLRMSQYTKKLELPRILDLPDAYSLYWERRKSVPRKLMNRLFDRIESRRVLKAERNLYKYDLNLACSVEDRDHLRNCHPGAKVELLRNGVNLDVFHSDGHNYSFANRLLFTGNMDYAPNVDAVVHFVKTMWPQIKGQHADLELVIAGQRPVKEVLDLAAKDIVITGFIPDLKDIYATASVVIAPLRFGAGTQNKVLEAMAMAVPVVCTDIGFKGLEINSGDGVIHSSNDDEFISNVLELLESEVKRKEVGEKGLANAKSKFSWDHISLELDQYFKSLS